MPIPGMIGTTKGNEAMADRIEGLWVALPTPLAAILGSAGRPSRLTTS